MVQLLLSNPKINVNIKSIFKKYSDLCKEEEELNKKKSEELSLYKNGSERCEQVKESASILEDQYKIVIEQLRTAAIKEAKLALQNRNRPLIFSKIQINGQTNPVKNFRMKLRLISLKSKIFSSIFFFFSANSYDIKPSFNKFLIFILYYHLITNYTYFNK